MKSKQLFKNCKNEKYLNDLLAKKWTKDDIKTSLLRDLGLLK
jgi:hypothetical protein